MRAQARISSCDWRQSFLRWVLLSASNRKTLNVYSYMSFWVISRNWVLLITASKPVHDIRNRRPAKGTTGVSRNCNNNQIGISFVEKCSWQNKQRKTKWRAGAFLFLLPLQFYSWYVGKKICFTFGCILGYERRLTGANIAGFFWTAAFVSMRTGTHTNMINTLIEHPRWRCLVSSSAQCTHIHNIFPNDQTSAVRVSKCNIYANMSKWRKLAETYQTNTNKDLGIGMERVLQQRRFGAKSAVHVGRECLRNTNVALS